jgi:hypothetical protein
MDLLGIAVEHVFVYASATGSVCRRGPPGARDGRTSEFGWWASPSSDRIGRYITHASTAAQPIGA